MERVTVLMVDDERGFITPVSKRLTRRGFDVLLAGSGTEALETLQEKEIDVVLLDISMPELDGIQTLGKIKLNHPLTEVLMLTAHAKSELVISSLGMGAYDYLMKPVELEELVKKIEDAMHRRKKNLSENHDTVAGQSG